MLLQGDYKHLQTELSTTQNETKRLLSESDSLKKYMNDHIHDNTQLER